MQAAERARLIREGVVPGGYPVDAANRATVKFEHFVISATSVLPGGLTFYHVHVVRYYPDPQHKTCARSFFDANLVTRTGKVTVTDIEFQLPDCDGVGLQGVTPIAVMVLENRPYVIAEKWAWEEHEDIVRELTDTGLISPPRLRLQ